MRQPLVDGEDLPHPVELVALAAVEAGRIGGVAVQLDHLVVGHAGGLVQAVDVLRDDGCHLALLDEAGERAVAGVGGGLLQGLVARELAPPGLAAGLGGGHEVAEVDGPELGPDAAGRAVVGDAQFGGDAGAGEGHHAFRLGDHALEIVDLGHRSSPSLCLHPRYSIRARRSRSRARSTCADCHDKGPDFGYGVAPRCCTSTTLPTASRGASSSTRPPPASRRAIRSGSSAATARARPRCCASSPARSHPTTAPFAPRGRPASAGWRRRRLAGPKA